LATGEEEPRFSFPAVVFIGLVMFTGLVMFIGLVGLVVLVELVPPTSQRRAGVNCDSGTKVTFPLLSAMPKLSPSGEPGEIVKVAELVIARTEIESRMLVNLMVE
jgi:hypothetical protein